MTKLGANGNGTFGIPSYAMGELEHKVKLLNRRAVKLGGGLGIQVVGKDNVKVTGEGGVARVIPVAIIRITGSVPVVAGFTFIARLEHHTGGNIISKAPGYEGDLPEQYRCSEANCDHCKTFRKRNDTFVLRNEKGEFVQVGRTCLQDYMRGEDPSKALKLFSLLSSLFGYIAGGEGGVFGFGGAAGFVSTTHFLACTVAAIRAWGWVSKKTAMETGARCTAVDADFLAGPCPKVGDSVQTWTENRPTDADIEEATDIVEWAGELGNRDNLSDYLHNLRIACSVGYVENKLMGIVASAVVARRYELEKTAAKAAKPASAHVGTVGERLTLNLTVTHVRYIESPYGMKTLVGLVDESGSKLVWWATNNPDFKAGEKITCKATVKKHDTYNGENQTVLTRLSVV